MKGAAFPLIVLRKSETGTTEKLGTAMRKRRIRIVQIGMSHEHAAGKMETLRLLEDVYDIAGVVDDTASSSPKFPGWMDPFKGLPRLTMDDLLQDPSIEGVLIETPNNDLVPAALLCTERNLPIHLDKPPGEDLEAFRTLLSACRTKNLPLQMGYMFRGNPAFAFCRETLRKGWLGNVFEIEADMSHDYGGDPYQLYLGQLPGGIMFNLGCHLIDFAVSVLGAPERVTPFLKSTSGTCPPAPCNNALAVLEYPCATVVIRCCSREYDGLNHRRLKISGTGGWIELSPLERFDGKTLEMTLALAGGNEEYPSGIHSIHFPPRRNRYEEQLLEFASLIRGEISAPWPPEQDLLVHEVLLAASGIRPLTGHGAEEEGMKEKTFPPDGMKIRSGSAEKEKRKKENTGCKGKGVPGNVEE